MLPEHDDAYPAIVRTAYDAWCAANAQEPIVATFSPDLYSARERAAIDGLLQRTPRPDAAFGVYNESGTHLVEVARGLGLSVPGDLAVACFSDDPAYAHHQPPVTTVSLQPAEVGAAAVELLIGLVNGRRGLQRQRLLPAVLRVRESSAVAIPRCGRPGVD